MLTSRDNPLVKLCRKLQTGARARREEGLFVAEGARLCREAFSAGVEVRALLATPQAVEKTPWLREKTAPPVQEISPAVAAAISDTRSPQGVFCLCAVPAASRVPVRPEGRYLLLDGLQDPGNLGTILRGAEAFGVTAVVLGKGCPDRFSPKVLRSTMGSAFRQPVLETEDLPGTIRAFRQAGVPVWAAMPEPGARTVGELPGSGGVGVVIGNEGSGVSAAAAGACDGAVYIPISPRVESLNAAAAATVIMWEIAGRGR